jgi:hypothetical protein
MLREIGGESIVVPVGARTVDLRGIIKLNATAAFLWKMMEKGCTQQELVEGLLEEFEVDEATAVSDVENFVETLRNNNLLDE